jgi:ornithine cyclodeaminase
VPELAILGCVEGQIRILREANVRGALDMASCIEACERAFAAYSGGRAELPDVIHLDVPESSGEVHVKAGHLHGHSLYAVKVASGFYGIDPPSIDGMVLVFDARTGAPVALLLDGGFLTDLRTGAAGGVAARHLAPETIEKIAVIGTGAQARYQLDALAVVRPGFERVTVWGRNRDHAEACVEDLRKRPALPDDCLFGTADTVQEAVEGADLVITCTASREPLVRAAWLTAGAHVTAVGADGPDKRELEPELLAGADLLVVDSRTQCVRIGELHHAIEAGLMDASHAVELGEICAGERPGRTSAEQLTVCDLTGVGVQDVAAAVMVMERVGGNGEEIVL